MGTPNLKPLADQVIVITGASSGIGLVTARMAAERGAKVLLVSRAGDALQRIVEEITDAGGTAAFAVADVGDLAAVQMAARKAVERFGRIDTWVNDAGVAIYAKLVDTPMAEHERLIRTNYFGMVHGALTAVEHLQREGGALITVGSIASDLPSPIMGAYAASKHAVKGYINSLRIEVNADRLPISITLVKPSGIDTPVGEHAANHLDGEALVPPPLYDPELVAEAILDAAQHPRRDVTVGGVGRLQVLLGEHFPGLLARFGGAMIPMLRDPGIAKTRGDNLDAPAHDGEARSKAQTGRGFSVYTAAGRHKGAVALAAAVGIAAVLGLASSSRKQKPKPRPPRVPRRALK
jgi:short-subunit dehydrogenase